MSEPTQMPEGVTPLPWFQGTGTGHQREYVCSDDGGVVAMCRTEQDAAFITLVCNSYPAKALREARDAINGLIGLAQLVASRDDLPLAAKHAIGTSHRVVDANAALKSIDAALAARTDPEER